MRLYRARFKIISSTGPETFDTVFKGQMFFVDGQSDLPFFNNTPEFLKEYWEELEVQTRFGHTKIMVRENA